MSARRPSGAVLGIGGIGSGLTFALNGDHTLGREESRAASLLDARDYCKLHIVLHHVRRLLPADVEVVPIGAVGDDAPGRSLLAQIAAEGMPTDRVALVAGAPTLFAVSFVYPSGDGGNLTTSGSASDQVTPGQARAALDSLETAPLVVAALPEVPLAARAALLSAAPMAATRVASFVTAEVEGTAVADLLADVDLVALNLDEARALCRSAAHDPADVARAVAATVRGVGARAIVTAGAAGSWSWDGQTLEHVRVRATVVRSTAGAGDAHLGAVIAALVLGAQLHEANRLGAVVSALKVTSADTINAQIDADLVRLAVGRSGLEIPVARRLGRGR